MDTVWRIGTVVLGSIMFWNLIFAVVIVFFGRRDPRSGWAWLLLLFLLPGAGFVFYLFLGGNLHKRKMFRAKELEENLQELLRDQKSVLRRKKDDSNADISGYEDLVMYNMSRRTRCCWRRMTLIYLRTATVNSRR